MKLGSFSICMILLVASVEASQEALGKYSLILEKGLFGKEVKAVPTTPPPTPVPPPAAAGWAKPYQMTMMGREAGTNRVRIGLQNTQTKTSMLLIEGDPPFEGYSLTSADFANQQATVVYGGVPHVFELTRGKSPAPASNNRNVNRSSNRTDFRRRNPPTVRPRATPTPKPPVQARQWKSAEEYQKHLQKQNEDAIRTGKPPLPIPLTSEQDARLVKEGVLPPR